MSATRAQPFHVVTWLNAQPWVGSVFRLRGVAAVVMLLLLADLALYTAWVRPTRTAVAQQQVASQAARAKLQRLFLYERTAQDLVLISEHLPLRRDLATAVGTVTSFARRRGVNIPEINFEPVATPSRQWSKVTLRFTATGRYANIRSFLASIEAAKEPFVIEELSLQRSGKSVDIGAKLMVGVYAREE